MKCPQCGKDLAGHATDVGYQLPDVVWALPPAERAERAEYGLDCCVLDKNRYFIRGVALIPIHDSTERFGWGIWAEVPQLVFDRYKQLFNQDGSLEPLAVGVVANVPQAYAGLETQEVDIRFGPADQRPTFDLKRSNSQMYLEQRDGISLLRVHELLEAADGS